MKARIAAVVLALCALPVAPAEGYVLIGRYWSDPTITYRADTERDRVAALYAARAWNRSGAGIRFRRTNGRADVSVRTSGAACGGVAVLGGRRAEVRLGRCRADLTKLVAAHEFGHVLGFGHERRRCALMNTSFDQTGTPLLCNRRPVSFWLADPLRADDERGARALRRLLR